MSLKTSASETCLKLSHSGMKKVVQVHNSSVRKQETPIQPGILTHGAVISHRTKEGDSQTPTQGSKKLLLPDSFWKFQLRYLNKRRKSNETRGVWN